MRFPHHARFAPLPLLVFLALAWSANAWGEKKNEPPSDKTAGEKKKEATPDAKESPSVCVKHTVQARYVNGFDHLVHITNECSSKAWCNVSTDVNPDIQRVSLVPGASTTVLTFRGSPARTFRAKVECVLEGTPD